MNKTYKTLNMSVPRYDIKVDDERCPAKADSGPMTHYPNFTNLFKSDVLGRFKRADTMIFPSIPLSHSPTHVPIVIITPQNLQ